MPYYNNANYLIHENDPAYNATHGPGQAVPFSGIYRCDGCGISIVSTRGNTLPPQNHHQHNAMQGQIRWRLAVKSSHV